MLRAARLGLLLLPFLLAPAFATAGLDARDPCGAPFDHPALGRVCPVDGGFLVLGADGSVGFTHGVDPIPAARPPGLPAATPVDVHCVDESEPHLIAVYMLPKNAPVTTSATGFEGRKPLLVSSILNANGIVHAAGLRHGVDMRWKMLCDANGLPLIEPVTSTLRGSALHFEGLADELRTMGYGGADEKVLFFYEGSWAGCGGCGGMSYIPGGDEADPMNHNNFGHWGYSGVFLGNYGVTAWWALDEVVLHEVTHSMGGVQLSAPNSSGGWHCNDGWDIMCYADGGSSSSYATSCHRAAHGFVALSQPYDCGNDDYFHPDPPAGSYLDTHWNVGATYNRFIQRL